MALDIALGTTQFLSRNTNIIPGSSDMTIVFWARITDLILGNYRTFFYQQDAGYTEWTGLFSRDLAINQFDTYISVGDGGGQSNGTPSPNNVQYTWVPMAYVRDGNNHTLFHNWKELTSVTRSTAAANYALDIIGNDGFSQGAVQFKYFRMWNKAKTLNGIKQEWQSATVVDTDSLWLDTPLDTDANDISGNGRDWTNNGSATFVSSDPFIDYNQWFIANADPAISPSVKGTWNTVPSSTFMLHPIPQYLPIATRTASETSATNPFNLGIARLVSPPLAAQTISGTIDMVMGALESAAGADFFTKLYIYVTQGDSTTLVRGVLLDFNDTSGTEWPTTAQGIGLSSPQTLSTLAISAGDHLVIEYGVRATNASTTSFTATMYRGSLQSNYHQYDRNLELADTNVMSRPSYFYFSESIQMASGETTNLNADRAIEIFDPFPYIATQWTPSTYSYINYFKYTGVGEKFLSAYQGTAAAGGNEEPQMGIYIYVADTPTNIGNAGTAQLRAWQFPAHDGIEYFFQCGCAVFLNPPGITMTFRVEEFISSQPSDLEGLMLIIDDRISVNYEPISAYIDRTDGRVTQLTIELPQSENAVSSRINGNIILTGKASPVLGNVYFYDKNVNLLSTDTTTLSSSGQENPPVCETDNFFYAGQYVSGDGTIRIRRWDLDGNLDSGSWDLPLPSNWARVSGIAVSRDDSILYYTNAFTNINNVVKRWDLVNNIALTDFLDLPLSTQFTRDIIVSTNGYIYVGIHDTAPSPNEDKIVKYDSAGNEILTIDLDVAGYGTLDHFAMGIDDTISIIVWQQKEIPTDSLRVINTYIEFNVNSGSLIDIETGLPKDFDRGIGELIDKGDLPIEYFGIPNSCPLLILLNPGIIPPPPANPLSGIYKIIPWSRKTNDTLYISLDPVETENRAIPNPFGEGPLLGN